MEPTTDSVGAVATSEVLKMERIIFHVGVSTVRVKR